MSDGRCPKCLGYMTTAGCYSCGNRLFAATRLPLSVQEAASLGEIASLRLALNAAEARAAAVAEERDAAQTELAELRANCTQQVEAGPVYGCALCGGRESHRGFSTEGRVEISGVWHEPECYIVDADARIDAALAPKKGEPK